MMKNPFIACIIEIVKLLIVSLPWTIRICIIVIVFSFSLQIMFGCRFKRRQKRNVGWLLYIAFLVSVTLLSRDYVDDPLERVWEGWWIVKIGNAKPYWNFDPLFNIFLLSPIGIAVAKIHGSSNRSLLQNAVILFLCGISVSLLIEIIQLLFHKGTFQVSDLAYNSLGVVLAGLLSPRIRHIVAILNEKVTKLL